MKYNILGLDRYEISQILKNDNDASSIFKNIYQKGYLNFAFFGKRLNRILSDKFYIEFPKIVDVLTDSSETTKLVMESQGSYIESVLIPSKNRLTLCISSQIGCLLDCTFCYTAKIGFRRNLETWEIVGQYIAAMENLNKKITHIVFMGMGEPLLNTKNVIKAVRIFKDHFGLQFSSRNITISTAGILPELHIIEKERVSLAISLNSPDNEKRSMLMPINIKYPLEKLFESLINLKGPARNIITFEYVLIRGVNDSYEDARKTAELLKIIRKSKINLVPFNKFNGSIYNPPLDSEIENFRKYLESFGIMVTVRNPRGREIMGACGQLGSSFLNLNLNVSH
mgnify:CR=1 FL=1